MPFNTAFSLYTLLSPLPISLVADFLILESIICAQQWLTTQVYFTKRKVKNEYCMICNFIFQGFKALNNHRPGRCFHFRILCLKLQPRIYRNPVHMGYVMWVELRNRQWVTPQSYFVLYFGVLGAALLRVLIDSLADYPVRWLGDSCHGPGGLTVQAHRLSGYSHSASSSIIS